MGASPSLILGLSEFPDKCHVYQGGSHVLDKVDWFQQHMITHVISICDRTVGATVLEETKISSQNILHFRDLDAPTTNLYKYFERTTRFIHEARCEGGNVLIHCAAGISRSSTITLAYLMTWLGEGYDKLILYLAKKREGVAPNGSFVRQLKKWESDPIRLQMQQEMKNDERICHLHAKDYNNFMNVDLSPKFCKLVANSTWTEEDDLDFEDEFIGNL
jgi:protein-tyrosine phosphatase